MKETFTILKLQFKRSMIRVPEIKGKNFFSPFLAVVLLMGIFASFFLLMFRVSTPFYKLDLERTYITFVISLLLVISLMYQTVEILKNFYYDKEHDLYAKLPVPDYKIKLAKSTYIIIKQFGLILIYFGFFIVPFTISSGYSLWFYLRLLATTLLIVPLPFLGAVLLSIPTFFIINVLKRHFTIAILGVIIVLGIFYYLYTRFIQVVMNLINNSGGYINSEQLQQIKDSTNALFFGNSVYNIISETNFWYFVLYLLLLLAIFSIAAIFAYYLLLKLSSKLQSRKDGKQKKYNFKQTYKQNQVTAILKKELKTIFRNTDYAFQVIVINTLMPLFIIMTVRVTAQLGAESVGILIVPGVALLTTLIFIILSSNFQSNLVSSEKQAHYLGLIFPIRYRYYLLVRIILPIVLNTVMMTIGLAALLLLKLLTIGQFFLILGISFFFLLGYSLISIYKDYKNPEFSSGVGRSINFLTNVALGLILAVVMGTMLSILPFFNEKRPGGYYFPIEATYAILMAIAISYFLITSGLFIQKLRRDKV